MPTQTFTFNISLSVLNHLGRNLYRSFMTVLGEAISNSWDADADNVDLIIRREESLLIIKDDGDGMSADDFQTKFLKIGYSKRKNGQTHTKKGRPFIGRKGIGKLALLSCAKRVVIFTKTSTTEIVGGIIDNSDLDEAIEQDQAASQYLLDEPDRERYSYLLDNFETGTILIFEELHETIKNRIDYLRKSIALHFRFSLIDNDFRISVNGRAISQDDLRDLANTTEFLWIVNESSDPFVTKSIIEGENYKEKSTLTDDLGITGFLATVELPSQLKIRTTEEKVGVDLFVNGRLREKNILKHIPSSRIVENYVYGQIHFDEIDGDVDVFTSSREGIISDDPNFQKLLTVLKKLFSKVISDWDNWRRKHKEDGDSDNIETISPLERKSEELFNVVAKEFTPPKDSPNKEKVDQWITELTQEATFNIPSYTDCFIAENLIRKFIDDQNTQISPEAQSQIQEWQRRESMSTGEANISFDIRQDSRGIMYLGMRELSALVDKCDRNKEACLYRDSFPYKPVRDALAHTSLITKDAKALLRTVFSNIRARIIILLTQKQEKN